MAVTLGPFSYARVTEAVDDVYRRLIRATRALAGDGVPYAVVGGNAVAVWVSRIDKRAVRFTQDVDILLGRSALEAAKIALGKAGFFYRHTAGLDIFLDGVDGRPRDAVHIVFANEKVRPTEPVANPDVSESVPGEEYQVVSLEALVRIKLTAHRDKDRTHVRDLIDVGLVDETWPARMPTVLGERLQALLDTPGG